MSNIDEIIEVLDDSKKSSSYGAHIALKFRVLMKDEYLGTEFTYHTSEKEWNDIKKTYDSNFPFLQAASYIWDHGREDKIGPIPKTRKGNSDLLLSKRWTDDHPHVMHKEVDLDRHLFRLSP